MVTLPTIMTSADIAAAGGDPLARGNPATRPTTRLALFGDSIGNNAIYSDGASPDGKTVPAWFIDGATNNNWRGWGYASWLGPLSMQRIQVGKSWARQTNGLLTPGVTPTGVPLSVQIDQALVDPAYATCDAALMMIGTNDFGFSIAAAKAELIAQAARFGKPLFLVSVPPRGDIPAGSAGDSMEVWAWLTQWRKTLKDVSDASGGKIVFIDACRNINSPLLARDTLAQPAMSYDGIHPNNAAAYLIALAIVTAMMPSLSAVPLDVWPNSGWAGAVGAVGKIDQGFSNPLFATASGGTGTGTVASGLTVTNLIGATHTGTVATSTIPDTRGNMQTIAMTSAAAGDGVNVAIASVHASGGTFLAAGDRAFAQAVVRVNGGGIYPRNLRLLLNGFQSPTNYFAMLFEIDTAKEVALPFAGTRTLLLRTPILTMPAGAAFSNLAPALRATFAEAGNCTIDIAHLEVRRIRA